jgi:hypothetical protein
MVLRSDIYPEAGRRRHPRVPASFLVKTHAGGRVVLHKARNLSMTGLLLEGDTGEDHAVLLEIPLPDQHRSVVTTGRVTRREGTRTALHFEDLDWDDICALARYVAPRLP